jgi:hypothetical protein
MERPQIVCFQEFDPNDEEALSLTAANYRVIQPKGSKGLPILLKKTYVESVISTKSLTMATGDSGVRPTPATEVVFWNRFGTKTAILNTHPMAHLDDPDHRAAHKTAIENIEEWVAEQSIRGNLPMVFMDGNGTKKIKGLVSCWEGHNPKPTGPGGATIDIIFAPKASDGVDTFDTPSDHNGVVATYKRLG